MLNEGENNNKENICNYDGCKRKLKLINQLCKCGKTFCRFHKFPEDHKCEYNYKSQETKIKDIEALECRPAKIQKLD